MLQSGIVQSFAMPIGGLAMQCLATWMNPVEQSLAETAKKIVSDANRDEENGNWMRIQGMTVQRWSAHLFLLSTAVQAFFRGQNLMAGLTGSCSLALGLTGDMHPLHRYNANGANEGEWYHSIGIWSKKAQPPVDFVVKAINLYPLAVHGMRLWSAGGVYSQVISGTVLGGGFGLTLAALTLDPPKSE